MPWRAVETPGQDVVRLAFELSMHGVGERVEFQSLGEFERQYSLGYAEHPGFRAVGE